MSDPVLEPGRSVRIDIVPETDTEIAVETLETPPFASIEEAARALETLGAKPQHVRTFFRAYLGRAAWPDAYTRAGSARILF